MSQRVEQNDEIDLAELFASIWKNWWVVGLCSLFSLFLTGYYVFVLATPEYEASTRFELLDDDGGSALGQSSGLAALAGIGLLGSSSEAETLEDRILSRPFVDSIYAEAGFGDDPLFNGSLREPGLVAKIWEIILGPSEFKELTRDDYLVMAIDGLRGRMVINPGDNGIIELAVTHTDRARAAEIANVIVSRSLLDIFERERSETRAGLEYFAEELLQVRLDLDSANAAVRDFAISNSLRSAEELARTSSQLAQVRREIEVIDDSVVALANMDVDDFDGSLFAQTFPVSTSLSFRRLLNLSGDPSTWKKPTNEELARALSRLEPQRAPLLSSLNALESRAKSSGEQALRLSALNREVEVHKAIYESVITQFETLSLLSGYEPISGRIVETAIAPNGPASPKKSLIMALGWLLGLFLGIGLALIGSIRRGILYAGTSIDGAFEISDVRNYTRSQIGRLDVNELTPKQKLSMQDLLVSLSDNEKVVSFLATRPGDLVARISLSLSKAAHEKGTTAALVDLSSGTFDKLARKGESVSQAKFSKFFLGDGIDLIVPSTADIFLDASKSDHFLSELKSTYRRVFVILPAPERGTAVSRVVSKLVDVSIIVAERAKTTRLSVSVIKSFLSKSKVANSLLVIV